MDTGATCAGHREGAYLLVPLHRAALSVQCSPPQLPFAAFQKRFLFAYRMRNACASLSPTARAKGWLSRRMSPPLHADSLHPTPPPRAHIWAGSIESMVSRVSVSVCRAACSTWGLCFLPVCLRGKGSAVLVAAGQHRQSSGNIDKRGESNVALFLCPSHCM